MITSQTHQPVGSASAYPVYGPHVTPNVVQSSNHHMTMAPAAMPMPYSDNSAPYPTGPGPMPYPSSTPYPPATYSPQSTGAYPPTASCPYPPQPAPYNQAMINQQPPAYNEVVFNETHQKQAPYNPNFTG